MTSSVDPADFPLHDRRRAAIAGLIQFRVAAAGNPGLPTPDLQVIAEALGWKSTKTVERYIQKGGYQPPSRASYEIDPPAMRALIRCRGRVSKAHRLMKTERWGGLEPITYETFRTATKRLPAAWRAAMKDGDAARRDRELDIFIGHELLYEVIAIDEKEMSVWVRHPKTGQRADVYVLPPICETARVAVHAHITPDPPTSDDVVDALVGAMLPSPEFPYAGRPWAVRWDNLSEHLAHHITHALATFGIPVIFMNAYSPWENPYSESFNSYLEEWAVTQPTYKHGPTMRNREHVNKDALLPEFEVTRQRLVREIQDYNTKYVHSELGCTPDAEWIRSPHKPLCMAAENVRWMAALARDDGVVTRKGVRVDNDFYVHPILYDLMGTKVVTHKRKKQTETVEVFDARGSHLCTAIDRKIAPDSMWVEVQDYMTESRRVYREHERAASAEADEQTLAANGSVAAPLPHASSVGRHRAISEAQFAAARSTGSRVTGRVAGDRSRRSSE